METPFSQELLKELKPQVVIDASGADFKLPDIEGADLPLVMNPMEAVDGSRELGEYVAVVACGYGCSWTCRKVSHEIPGDVVNMKTSESYACSAGHGGGGCG